MNGGRAIRIGDLLFVQFHIAGNRRQIGIRAKPTYVIHMFMRDDDETRFADGRFHTIVCVLIKARRVPAALCFCECGIDNAGNPVRINQLKRIDRQIHRGPAVARHNSGRREMKIGNVFDAYAERLLAAAFMRQCPHLADVEIKARVGRERAFHDQPIICAATQRHDDRHGDQQISFPT